MSYDLETKDYPVRRHKKWPGRISFGESRSPTVKISFEPRQYQFLLALAKTRGISFGAAVRMILDRIIE